MAAEGRRSWADISADPYFRERGLITTVEDEVHGEISVPGVIPQLSETPGSIRRAARWEVGADTDDVLAELGIAHGATDHPGREGTA